jgi:hypothetical protein
MNSSQVPIARKEGLVVQEMPDEVLVYDLDDNKAFCLNSTAASIWKSCDGRKTVAEIAAGLTEGRDQDSKENIVWLALDQLKDKKLIASELTSRFEGQTRREVLKKVGLATAIALPVVAMLSFPGTVLAAACSSSTCGTQGTCPASQICCPHPSSPTGQPQCQPGFGPGDCLVACP